jgi:hypothetical protein
MPIPTNDVKKYERSIGSETVILKFLQTNKGNSYTVEEIHTGIGRQLASYSVDEKGSSWSWKNAGLFARDVADFAHLQFNLDKLVEKGSIHTSEYSGKTLYYFE